MPDTHTICLFDIVYIDASTWMAPEMESFLKQVEHHLLSSGKHLTMTGSVYRELRSCAPYKYAAQTALDASNKYSSCIHIEPAQRNDNGTADSEFVRHFFFNHRKRRQLLITHDHQLAADIQNCCRHEPGDEMSTVVMTLWQDGSLITFAEKNRRKEQQARVRLEEMLSNAPLYMDASALHHEKLETFLHNISAPMRALEKKLRILCRTLPQDVEDTLQPFADILQPEQLDATRSETEAIMGELYLSPANIGIPRLILITNNIAQANELRSLRPKCDQFPYVDFMCINKYGYLSFLKLSDQPVREKKPRFAASLRPVVRNTTTGARKPAAFVPQLIGTIKNEDLEGMLHYIDKGANLRHGIITALCQSKDNCLRALLENSAGNIEQGAFEWWVTLFNGFDDPQYLATNPEHYELLCMLTTKSEPLTRQQKAMLMLADRVSAPDTAHEQLWQIIRLAIANGAPEAVYARTTGETLPEIATRQGNEEMLRFLNSR